MVALIRLIAALIWLYVIYLTVKSGHTERDYYIAPPKKEILKNDIGFLKEVKKE